MTKINPKKTARRETAWTASVVCALSAAIAALGLALAAIITGCSSCGAADGAFDAKRGIEVVSREDGSGTRSAFVELFSIADVDGKGGKKDLTTKEAVIARQTDVMMTNISRGKYGIGYISLGSLNDTVKALTIDGVEATPANIKSGGYKAARLFYIAMSKDKEASPLASDFAAFILSAEGQAVVAKSYIAIDDAAPPYVSSRLSGKAIVAGSSSVTPIMEKLREAYIALNPDSAIEILMSDSTAGLSAAVSGICDIAMSSRSLNESETEKLKSISIAIDGIAVIVNNSNPLNNLSGDQVKAVFTGKTANWSDLVVK